MAVRKPWRGRKSVPIPAEHLLPIASRSEVRPLYVLVYETLLAQVASGVWKAGDLIPNEIQLARDLGVSVGTLRKAVQILVDRDLLVRKQGRGTFVAKETDKPGDSFDPLRDGTGHPLSWTVEHTEVSAGLVDPTEAQALQLRSKSKVLRLRRVLRAADSDTRLLERCSLPQELFAGLASDLPALDLPIGQLARHFGIVLGGYAERVAPGFATGLDAARLDIPTGTPVLQLARVVYCVKGEPIEHRQASCRLGGSVYYANENRGGRPLSRSPWTGLATDGR